MRSTELLLVIIGVGGVMALVDELARIAANNVTKNIINEGNASVFIV